MGCLLNNIGIWVQIFTNFFLIIGGIIAIWQYYSSKRNELYRYNKDRIHLAIEIAEYYKENVLSYSRELKTIAEKIGIFDLLEDVKLDEIQYFDIIEIGKVYNKKQLKRIKEKRSKYRINISVSEQSVSYRYVAKEYIIENTTKEKVTNNLKGTTIEQEQTGKMYADLMFKILNNLEIFSMYFVHEVADESVVYQPLHMSFLEIVRLLYYDISYANRNGETKFYVNTIKLFNIWKTKSLKQQKIETDTIRSIAEEGKILPKINEKDT